MGNNKSKPAIHTRTILDRARENIPNDLVETIYAKYLKGVPCTWCKEACREAPVYYCDYCVQKFHRMPQFHYKNDTVFCDRCNVGLSLTGDGMNRECACKHIRVQVKPSKTWGDPFYRQRMHTKTPSGEHNCHDYVYYVCGDYSVGTNPVCRPCAEFIEICRPIPVGEARIQCGSCQDVIVQPDRKPRKYCRCGQTAVSTKDGFEYAMYYWKDNVYKNLSDVEVVVYRT